MSSLPHHPRSVTIETRSAEETRRLALALTPILLPGDVLALSGDLGAGKTTFVQGLAAGLKVPEHVTSPTFVLMKEYAGGKYPLMHIDIYRLDMVQEVIDLGWDEFLDPGHVVAIEWGDAVEPLLPREHLIVKLTYADEDSVRHVTLVPRGPNWRSRIETVRILMSDIFSPSRDAEDLGLADPFQGRHN